MKNLCYQTAIGKLSLSFILFTHSNMIFDISTGYIKTWTLDINKACICLIYGHVKERAQ